MRRVFEFIPSCHVHREEVLLSIVAAPTRHLEPWAFDKEKAHCPAYNLVDKLDCVGPVSYRVIITAASDGLILSSG
jgi:hypothetical protein